MQVQSVVRNNSANCVSIGTLRHFHLRQAEQYAALMSLRAHAIVTRDKNSRHHRKVQNYRDRYRQTGGKRFSLMFRGRVDFASAGQPKIIGACVSHASSVTKRSVH
jgi:hypothetical protein